MLFLHGEANQIKQKITKMNEWMNEWINDDEE